MDRTVKGYPYAKAAIDMALYDIVGKLLKTPVYNLLGGRVRDSIPLSMSIPIAPIDDMVSHAKEAIRRGFKGVKIKVGVDGKHDIEASTAIRDALGPGSRIALIHATAYTDDAQVMRYLARRLEECGARPVLASPAHLRWRDGAASTETLWDRGPLDALVRFFPAEWLTELPSSCGWPLWFAGAATPLSNPATAILTQSKRFPLVWDALATPLPTWRRLLPETRDPRAVRETPGDPWVLKPALGRIGEDIALPGVTPIVSGLPFFYVRGAPPVAAREVRRP